MVEVIVLTSLLLSSATLPALEVAAVWSDELDDDDEKLPPDSEDMLEASDVLVLTIAMLSSSILLAALSFVGADNEWAIGGVIFVSAAAVLLLSFGATWLVLVDLCEEL